MQARRVNPSTCSRFEPAKSLHTSCARTLAGGRSSADSAPRAGLAALIGYQFLVSEVFRHPRRLSVLLLIGIGGLLMLTGIKYQPPVATFESTPPGEGWTGVQLFGGGLLTLLFARILMGRDASRSQALSAGDPGGRRFGRLALAAGLLAVPLAFAGLSSTLGAHLGTPPNQRLVQYAHAHYDIERVAVCWDGQTHAYFEVMNPHVVPLGYWSLDELVEAHLAGETLLVTDRCVRFKEISSVVALTEVAEFNGMSPVWTKLPSITLFATAPPATHTSPAMVAVPR